MTRDAGTTISGGCRCGAVRYAIDAPSDFDFFCQCRDCQRFSGTGHMANMKFPKDAMTVTGETRAYEYTGGSGNPVLNVFCANCGSPLYGGPKGADFVIVRVGSLDDPAIFEPRKAVYTAGAQPWDRLDPDLS